MAQRVALVTGAAAGIGAAIARRLARDNIAIGVADILLDDAEKVAADIREKGGKAIAVNMNVADRAEVNAGLQKVRETLGPVTIVVNNAGITGFRPFEELTDEEWDRVMQINLKGTFIVTQCALPDMKAAHWGRVVNISSSSAQTGAATMAHYSASKGGVIALTKTLARELGPFGVTCNNIPPSSVMNTVMSEKSLTEGRFGAFGPGSREALAQMAPVGRVGEPEDIAGACAWLVSDEASYVTGQTIGVNGGRVIY